MFARTFRRTCARTCRRSSLSLPPLPPLLFLIHEEAKPLVLREGSRHPRPPAGLSVNPAAAGIAAGRADPRILPSPKPSPERSRNSRKAPEPTGALAWRAYCEAIKRAIRARTRCWNPKMGGIFGNLVKGTLAMMAAPMAVFYVEAQPSDLHREKARPQSTWL